MKIVYLSQAVPPARENGGIGTYTSNLANQMSVLGQEVHIITKSAARYTRTESGVHIHGIDSATIVLDDQYREYPVVQKNIAYSRAIQTVIAGIMRQGDIDIIDSSNWDTEGLVSQSMTEIPTVARLVSPLVEVIETMGWEWNDDLKLMCMLEKKYIESSSQVIYASDAIKKTVQDETGCELGNAVKIPYGIPLIEMDKTAVHQKDGDSISILFVGRLERRKGIHVLLEVIPRILSKYSHVSFRLVGNDAITDFDGKTYRQKFEQSSKSLLNRVKFLGILSNDELNKEYQNCDIFVAPSTYESFGLIYLEAWQYAKPVIGCDVGGIPEVIEKGVSGLLSEPENPELFMEDLERLIIDEELRITIGRAGRQRLIHSFSINSFAEDSLALYHRISNRKKK